MQDLLRDCLEAGAVGLSTSFVDVDEKLHPVPSRYAYRAELDALANVLGEYGRMLQVVPEFYATDLTIARIDQLAELSLKYNIPTTFSPLFDSAATPDNVPRTMARVEEQFARGARVWPQVQTRPIDISFSFERPSLYFGRFPSWYRVMRLPRAERIAALRDAETVERMVNETGADGGRTFMGRLIVRGGEGAPEALVGRTLEEHRRRARRNRGAVSDQRLARERPARAVPGRERRPPGRAIASVRCSRIRWCTSAPATAARTSRRSRRTATPASCSAATCAKRTT